MTKKYSRFMETLYDDKNYLILQAMVFDEPNLVTKGREHSFIVIWDEDKDDRIISVVERLYKCNILGHFTMLREHDGHLQLISRWLPEVIRKILEESKIVEGGSIEIYDSNGELDDHWDVSIEEVYL